MLYDHISNDIVAVDTQTLITRSILNLGTQQIAKYALNKCHQITTNSDYS